MVTAVDPRMPLKFLPWQSRYRWDVPSRRGPSFSRPTCAISIFQMGMGQNCHLHHPHGRFMAGFSTLGWPVGLVLPASLQILVFMLSILRCKGVQVVLVPSCLQLLLDAGEKEAYYIILLFFNQDRSGFIPTIWQSHLTLGNLHIFPGERTVICNTGGFLIATPPAVRWGFRYYMDVCL